MQTPNPPHPRTVAPTARSLPPRASSVKGTPDGVPSREADHRTKLSSGQRAPSLSSLTTLEPLRLASAWIRRPLELAAAALACVVLYLTGVLSHASLPSILIALAVAAVFGSIAQRRLGPNASVAGLYGWIGLHMAGITAVIYASGWGPVLAIGYVFPASEVLQVVGRGAMRPVAVWALLGILAGELAIGLGLAPSAIEVPLAHHVAVVGAIGLMFVLRLVSMNVGEKDRALELLRHALLRLNVLHSAGPAGALASSSRRPL